MSLYRELGRTSPLRLALLAAGGLLVGLVIGFAIGKGASEEPSLEDAVAQVQEDIRPAVGALELVTIEYREGVKDGRVVARSEYDASLAHVGRAQEALKEVAGELEVLGPEDAAVARRSLEELRTLVERRAAGAQVDAAAERARAALQAAARLEG